jgi:5'-deoxynucleotidase YfbR-like HD superfamily hydrolase
MPALYLNLREMVCGIGNQLRYVDRFSTCRRGHKENVAEHQFFTAFFALLICKHLEPGMKEMNVGLAVIKGLIHDVEEHYTGDVIRPVKHGSVAMESEMDKAGADFACKFFQSLTRRRDVASQLFTFWRHAKDSTPEGRVVRFADYLSVLAYLHQEVRSGNKLVMDNVHQLEEYSSHFDVSEYEFIRSLVVQAKKLVKDLRRGKV